MSYFQFFTEPKKREYFIDTKKNLWQKRVNYPEVSQFMYNKKAINTET
jgi:hypothetical protein